MTTQDRAVELTKLNIYAIFGEKDPKSRLRTISSLWAPDNELLFVDPTSVSKSHLSISNIVGKIQSLGSPEDEFVISGDVECLKHDEEEDIWVTRVKWGVGSKGGKPNLTGWDILTIVGGRIKACYTFLDPQ